MNSAPAHVFAVYIQTTPDRIWQAITSKAMTEKYYFGTHVQSTWEKGASINYLQPNGEAILTGEILEIDPPKRLVTTFKPLWGPCAESGAVSEVTYTIEPLGPTCKLTISHVGLPEESIGQITEGWQKILSGIKTLLETGKSLEFAM